MLGSIWAWRSTSLAKLALAARSGLVHGDAVGIVRSQTTLPQDDTQSSPDRVGGMMASPVVHGAVEFAVYGQVGALVRAFCGERLIDVDAKSGRLAGMHQAIFKTVGVRKNSVRLRRMAHILLDAKIMNAQVEMKRRRHANRT